jgi:hypothetical protein
MAMVWDGMLRREAVRVGLGGSEAVMKFSTETTLAWRSAVPFTFAALSIVVAGCGGRLDVISGPSADSTASGDRGSGGASDVGGGSSSGTSCGICAGATQAAAGASNAVLGGGASGSSSGGAIEGAAGGSSTAAGIGGGEPGLTASVTTTSVVNASGGSSSTTGAGAGPGSLGCAGCMQGDVCQQNIACVCAVTSAGTPETYEGSGCFVSCTCDGSSHLVCTMDCPPSTAPSPSPPTNGSCSQGSPCEPGSGCGTSGGAMFEGSYPGANCALTCTCDAAGAYQCTTTCPPEPPPAPVRAAPPGDSNCASGLACIPGSVCGFGNVGLDSCWQYCICSAGGYACVENVAACDGDAGAAPPITGLP